MRIAIIVLPLFVSVLWAQNAYSQLDVKMFSCLAQYTVDLQCFKKTAIFSDPPCGGGITLDRKNLEVWWAKDKAQAQATGCEAIINYAVNTTNATYSQACVQPQWGGGTTSSAGYCHRRVQFDPSQSNHFCRCEEEHTPNYIITFQTQSKKKYFGASNGGGDFLYANADHFSFEREIKLYDNNGGKLEHGDRVQLQSPSGHWIVTKDGKLSASSSFTETAGIFDIYKANFTGAKEIKSGDVVLLKAYLNKPVKVRNGDDHEVRAGVTESGEQEFVLTILNKEQFGHPIQMEMKFSKGPNLQEMGEEIVVTHKQVIEVPEGSIARMDWESEHTESCELSIGGSYSTSEHSRKRGLIDLYVERNETYKMTLVCRTPSNHLIETLEFTVKVVPKPQPAPRPEPQPEEVSLSVHASTQQEGRQLVMDGDIREGGVGQQVRVEWKSMRAESCEVVISGKGWQDTRTELGSNFDVYLDEGETVSVTIRCTGENKGEVSVSFQLVTSSPTGAPIEVSEHSEPTSSMQTE